jgi:uncharacterized protein (TIGR02594 family)
MTPEWMQTAEKELARGVRELPGVQHNSRILEYHDATSFRATSDEVPWCSSFVNWCFQQNGYEGTRSAAARSWLLWGQEIEPEYGAVVVLARGGNPALGHVGFFTDRRPDGKILLLGGNQRDSVSIAAYPHERVLSYRWPKNR